MADEHTQPGEPEPFPSPRRRRRFEEDDDRDEERAELPRLGRLAVEARNKHLKQARRTLLFLGILWALVQVVFYFVDSSAVNNQIQIDIQRAGGADPAAVKEYRETLQRLLILIHGGAIAVALAFVVLSFFVEKYPVPVTATALVLFIGAQVIFAVLNPLNIVSGLLVKIIVLVALFKALQAGLAAQKERREAELSTEYGA